MYFKNRFGCFKNFFSIINRMLISKLNYKLRRKTWSNGILFDTV